MVARLRAAGCVFAEEEAQLLIAAAPDAAGLALLVQRRAGGEPLEQLLGWVDFCGLRLEVGPGVFVPRRRTGLLVDLALPVLLAVPDRRRPVIVDLCCGCGAVGVVLATGAAAAGHPAELHAVDVEPAAATYARRNVAAVGGHVHLGDLDEPLPDRLAGAVDVLVANAPYVPTGELAFLPPEARSHEPAVALDGGADGLDVVRRIALRAAHWLRPDGVFVVESSRRQAPVVAAALREQGLVAGIVTDDDLAGTAVTGRLRGRRSAGPG